MNNTWIATSSGSDFFLQYGKPLLPTTVADAALSNTVVFFLRKAFS